MTDAEAKRYSNEGTIGDISVVIGSILIAEDKICDSSISNVDRVLFSRMLCCES